MASFKELRKQLKLTQEEMAARMRITRSYYGLLETGQREPSETLLSMLDLMERGYLLEKKLAEPSLGVDHVRESPMAYGDSLSSSSSRPLIADPNSYPTDDRTASVLDEVLEHLRQLQDAARANPDQAAVIRFLLRKHIPLEDVLET